MWKRNEEEWNSFFGPFMSFKIFLWIVTFKTGTIPFCYYSGNEIRHQSHLKSLCLPEREFIDWLSFGPCGLHVPPKPLSTHTFSLLSFFCSLSSLSMHCFSPTSGVPRKLIFSKQPYSKFGTDWSGRTKVGLANSKKISTGIPFWIRFTKSLDCSY